MNNASIELAECGQRGRTHPHDQVLVLVAVLVGLGAQVGDSGRPVDRFGRVVPRARVVEFDILVGRPRDAAHRRAHVDGRADARLAQIRDRKRVVEQRVGNGTARRVELASRRLVEWRAVRAHRADGAAQ